MWSNSRVIASTAAAAPVYIPLHCDRCAACKRGDTQMCLEVSSLIGWNRPGGYAEYVPVPENCLLEVPDDIEDSLAPLLLDVIGTSGHAVRFVSRVVPSQEAGPVLVMGAGPVGLGVVLALRSLGYDDIHVADPNATRLAIAQSFGARAHPVGDTSKRFALIMECSGAHAARNLGIELVLPRGALVLVGENAAPWTIEEGKVFRRKDFYMIRTFYFPVADFEPNVALLRRYKDEYRVLVDRRVRPFELAGEFCTLRQGRADQARAGAGLTIMASISIRNLVKRYGNLAVIPDLNLEIADHEFVVFVGPSGCGKSTLLPDHRRARADHGGRSLYRRQTRQRHSGGAARYRHGVPGLRALSAYARLRQHVLCARAAGHAEAPRSTRRVKRAAALLHIEPYLDRKPKELSGGQRQRVAMGRAHRAQIPRRFCSTSRFQSRRKAARAGAGRNQGIVAGAEDHDGLRHP